MALSDNLLTEKESLTTLLETEYNQQNLRGELLQRLFFVRFLLGELVGSGGGGDASAANQTVVQANPGSDASKAVAIQGITNGKPVPVVLSSSLNVNASQSGAWTVGLTGTLPAFTTTPTFNIGTSLLALESGGNLAGINAKLPSNLTVTSNRLLVDNSGVTQPVSITAAIETQSRHTENTDTFTAPGVGASQVMNGYIRAFITLTIASINTNVVFRIEGSNDNTNWANLDINNQDTTFTTNGTYAFTFEGCPQRIRVNFVSESGGTAATITAITRLAS